MSRRPPRAVRPRATSFVRERASREGSPLARLKQRLAMFGLAPRKRFGQNFLVRDDLADRIVDHARLQPDDVALEIGPGAGALTGRIAKQVRELVAVERDTGLAELLREEFAELGRIEIVEADFLTYDLAALAARAGQPVAVVGNIPYNITTPILEHLFAHRAAWRSAVLLVQKEYAERLGAAAGTPAYGSLTLFTRYHVLLEPLMAIRASAFWPRPDVDSALIRMLPRERPPVEVPDEALLFALIRGSFHMRRKQLVNTLEETLGWGKERIDRLCRQARIDPKRRGETLTLEEFARLARDAHQRLDGR